MSKLSRAARTVVESLENRALFAVVSTGFTDTTYVSGLTRPVHMTWAPDGRLFVSEQDGKVRIVKNGQLLSGYALKLNVSKSGERGVQGIAFDPDFDTNKFVYIYYTGGSPVHNNLSRFKVNGDVIDPASETKILDLPDLNSVYHNGGDLHFGEDGKLYISVGDNARGTPARQMDSLFGKILRINKDGSIPSDNPFYNANSGIYRAIYHYGLRNPYSFAINPANGRLFICDVGENSWEEVNTGPAGSNFGWPSTEGPTSDANFVSPIYAWNHTDGGTAAIGGDFYPNSGGNFPAAYKGTFIFGDHLDGWIKAINPSTGAVVGTISKDKITAMSDVAIGPDGNLYYLERTFTSTAGRIGKISYNAVNGAPAITTQPKNVSANKNATATFSVVATGDTPLSYVWQTNGAAIPGANSSSYSFTATDADNGAKFRCVVSNAKGNVVSEEGVLTINGENPVPVISSPSSTLSYRAGDTISFSGSATDPQDGTLGASAFLWQVDFHHDAHLHPFVAPTEGVKSGTFKLPDIGEVSSNTWYRVILTVTDSDGNQSQVERDIFPKKSKITLATNVPGLKLTLDDQPKVAPINFTGVEYFKRNIAAPATQTLNNITYEFVSWSDAGAAAHTIKTPTADTTYTATYRVKSNVGTGLFATYYNNRDFTGTKVTRIDPVLNFLWEDGSPDQSITRDTFSARWTGLVKADFDETYTFYTKVDDGVRLWVGGQKLIDKWVTTGTNKEYSATIALKKGKSYEIRMDYFENTGNATAQLRWSSASTSKQVIPETALFPELPSDSTTIEAGADTYVRGGASKNLNFGSEQELRVKYAGTDDNKREAWMKFDLSGISSSFTSAKLQFVGRVTGNTPTNVPLQLWEGSSAGWSEGGLTFANRPGTTGNQIASKTLSDINFQTYTIDITNWLKAAKNAGKTNVSLILKTTLTTDPQVAIQTRESGNPAKIIVA
jgi:glucose/arabinose dehydrogenase